MRTRYELNLLAVFLIYCEMLGCNSITNIDDLKICSVESSVKSRFYYLYLRESSPGIVVKTFDQHVIRLDS